jgi:hypothetical protein
MNPTVGHLFHFFPCFIMYCPSYLFCTCFSIVLSRHVPQLTGIGREDTVGKVDTTETEKETSRMGLTTT